ncbi:MAG: M28 family peptidase [Actinobacteria bacterium]|nr:M28 family peptidase [Actinomycetota bacterium]
MAAADKYRNYMYGLVDRAVSSIGPRESCSDEEKRLGRLFAQEIEPTCERIDVEQFTCSPKAFLGFFPYLVLLYLAGVVLYYIYPPVSIILSAIGIGILFYEVVRYRELIDLFYPKREGENVAGFVAPRGEVRKRVIVSAHLDSAYEFKVWYWLKGQSVPAMAVAFLAPVLLLGASLARTIADSSGVPDNTAFTVLGIILIAISPVVAIFFFFHTRDVVPGAMDDMAGIAVVAGLARYLRDAREGDGFYPEHTEIVLLALSSEEAGLRGAKRYAARHKNEYLQVPTFALFLDNIADERYLTAFKREVWCGAKMDPYLLELSREAAAANGRDIITAVMAVGATDASAFVREEIPSLSICCYNSSRLMPNYHTRHDTIENVRPESLAVSLQLVVDMIRRIDE